MAAKKSTAIPRKYSRPQFNPESVGAVARYTAQRRKRDADFDALHPNEQDSYGNGCNDGATLAERQVLSLALDGSGNAIPLIDTLFPGAHAKPSEILEYRRGLVVGYVHVLYKWAKVGTGASHG